MADTEFNGDNLNGWGFDPALSDHFLFRREGNIVAQIYKGKLRDKWHGSFMGCFHYEHPDMAQVFRVIVAKLVAYGY